MLLSEEDGKLAVEIARKTLDAYVLDGVRYEPRDIPAIFNENRGVFVTLSKFPSHELRGCIGFPEPVAPFIDALGDSAISAASRDPRFRAVEKKELGELVVEVSALSPPELIEVNDPSEYLSKIKVGRDGLIVDNGFSSGLLLPQVPIEWKWDVGEFLEHTCHKAGLPRNAWKNSETKIYSFQGQVWSEKDPRGKIVKKDLE
jgi:uncharacterized protein (TIGR00296 family)